VLPQLLLPIENTRLDTTANLNLDTVSPTTPQLKSVPLLLVISSPMELAPTKKDSSSTIQAMEIATAVPMELHSPLVATTMYGLLQEVQTHQLLEPHSLPPQSNKVQVEEDVLMILPFLTEILLKNVLNKFKLEIKMEPALTHSLSMILVTVSVIAAPLKISILQEVVMPSIPLAVAQMDTAYTTLEAQPTLVPTMLSSPT
jgi:hypothetical protein